MEEAELRYGDRSISLRKSENVIGLSAPTLPRARFRQISDLHDLMQVGRGLGSFELLAVQADRATMESRLDALRGNRGVRAGTHVFHVIGSEAPLVPTGQIYLVVEEDASRARINRLLKRLALQIVEARGPTELVVEVTLRSPNPVKAAAALQASDEVRIAEPDFASGVTWAAPILPNDPLLTSQWHLRNSGSINGNGTGLLRGADARIVEAWERGRSLGSEEIVVAIIDDGFDLSHPDLTGTGKIRSPRSFVDGSTNPAPSYVPGKPYFSQGEWQGDWHGTACAGLAVGNAQGSGILGAAPRAGFMPLKMDEDNVTDSQVEQWFEHARLRGASVVSCSWLGEAQSLPLSSRRREAIAKCAREGRGGLGTVILFAAGNDDRDINDTQGGYVNGYAIHPDVIAVAASTSLDERAGYSNFGREISICAPAGGGGGHMITTADVTGRFTNAGQQYEAGFAAGAFNSRFFGTSAATPIAAGICALLLSIRTSLTASDVRRLIQHTARKIGAAASYDANGHSRHFGYGCINADAAVRELLA